MYPSGVWRSTSWMCRDDCGDDGSLIVFRNKIDGSVDF